MCYNGRKIDIVVKKECYALLKVQEIRELIKLIDKSSIEEFKYEQDGSKITMKKAGSVTKSVQVQTPAVQTEQVLTESQLQPVPVSQQKSDVQEKQAAESAVDDANLHKIESPMVGTFYAASSPEAGPFVSVGSKVSPDTVVCIVEAMKLFNEIEADVKGEIVEVLVENGQLVEYGQPLFLVKTE